MNEEQLAPWISQDDLEEINFNNSNQLDNGVEEILEEVDIPPEGDNDDSR